MDFTDLDDMNLSVTRTRHFSAIRAAVVDLIDVLTDELEFHTKLLEQEIDKRKAILAKRNEDLRLLTERQEIILAELTFLEHANVHIGRPVRERDRHPVKAEMVCSCFPFARECERQHRCQSRHHGHQFPLRLGDLEYS